MRRSQLDTEISYRMSGLLMLALLLAMLAALLLVGADEVQALPELFHHASSGGLGSSVNMADLLAP